MKSKYGRIAIEIFLLASIEAIIQRAEFEFERYVCIGIDILMGALLLYGIYLAGHDGNLAEGKRKFFQAFFYFITGVAVLSIVLNLFIK